MTIAISYGKGACNNKGVRKVAPCMAINYGKRRVKPLLVWQRVMAGFLLIALLHILQCFGTILEYEKAFFNYRDLFCVDGFCASEDAQDCDGGS